MVVPMNQNDGSRDRVWCLRHFFKREVIFDYLFALSAVAGATYLRVLLQPLIGERVPFATFTLSVILVAWLCGVGPASVALILSSILSAHFIIPPENSLNITGIHDQIALAVFFVVGTVSIVLFGRLQSQRKHALEQAMENERLNQRLRQLDRQKDEFLSLLAHELRAPMAPIRNALCLAGRLPADSAERCAQLELINRNFKHLVRLVDDLLDVTRYLRGSIELKCEVVDLRQCIHSALEMMRNEVDEKQHELIVDLPTVAIPVYADPVRCCQIFCNLLSNAIKYTPEKGRIHVAASVQEEAIEVAIRDNGLGIAKSNRVKIFEPFFQANLKQTRFASGLGLGLTIVQKLVDLHGGKIEVSSRGVNAGSRFSVRFPWSMLRDDGCISQILPADAEEHRDRSSAPSAPSSPQKKVRVMIVDDNVDTAKTLSLLLELEGFETRVAHDGLTVVKSCQAFLPHVLLLDIGLPEIDGFQVAKLVRAEKFGRQIKIVAISGWGAEADKRASREAGMDAHLVKPATLDQLLPLLVSQELAGQMDAAHMSESTVD
jgi:two-component system CheB/CheR fusion protein